MALGMKMREQHIVPLTGDEMVSLGFRSMASTCLNEQMWHPDAIELQLTHAERNKVRAAYNRTTRAILFAFAALLR